jgi:hypothetical protein
MPLYFRVGAGPLRYSTRLSGGGRRRTSSNGGSGCLGWLFLIAAAVAFVGWPLLVFKRHWTTRYWADCTTSGAGACAGRISGHAWVTVTHSATSALGWGLFVVWLVLLAGLALLVGAGRSKQAQAARQQREEAEREQAAEREAREARTYRATVSGCRIDPVTGGEFTVTAPGHLDMHFAVAPDMALQFRSLRNRDAVEITLAPDGHGVEQFWHLARANGAKPRDPADFSEGFKSEVQEGEEGP